MYLDFNKSHLLVELQEFIQIMYTSFKPNGVHVVDSLFQGGVARGSIDIVVVQLPMYESWMPMLVRVQS